jgi:DNA invertase Pin-like site-specific DNA recombinase
MAVDQLLRAGIHARRSLNRADERSGSVRRQIEGGHNLAEGIGAEVVKIFDEDDTSAFAKRMVTLPDGRRVKRNVRPVWQEMLTWLYEGRIDVLIEYDLDRAMREPRDLEDLIEIIEQTGRRVESVTGSLRLTNDAEITQARVLTAFANKSSRDTSRRVRDAARERAVKGLGHGGPRPYGYTADRKHLVADEAAEVTKMFRQFLNGIPLAAIVRDLDARGVQTLRGKPWQTGSVRDILLSARHAGLATYQGEVVGQGQWPAIVSEPEWRAAVAQLRDPARRTSTGNRAAYLVSGIARCGSCDSPITSAGIKKSTKQGENVRYLYRCRPRVGKPGYCVGRRRDWVDGYVTERVLERLCRDDAASLLEDDERPDLEALRLEQLDIRTQLDDAAMSFARRAIDARQLELITKELQGRKAEIDAMSAHTLRAPVLRVLVEAGTSVVPDERLAAVEAVWQGLTLDHQRAVVSVLMEVVLHPGGGGRRTFDPTKVQIIPKR